LECMAWQSSSKPDRKDEEDKNYIYLVLLGFVGLLMEAVGFWLLFSWLTTSLGNFSEPSLILGSILSIVGFVVLTRWLSSVIRTLLG
jgi:uncharacterized BrkB/YihY/UPF0761 family membrane protein